ncbi:hypothetical protein HDU93_003882 [Gonapodya sp. JEL0774]|nr:hypothetical protein HDU93_003882 [Gonapodya sp. JEL0774]
MGEGSFVRHLLCYAVDRGAIQAAISALTCAGVDNRHRKVAREAVERWAQEDVVGEAIRLLSHESPAVSLGCAELVARVADDTAKQGDDPVSAGLFEPVVARASLWVAGVVDILTSKTTDPSHHRAALQVLDALVSRRTYEAAAKPFTEGTGVANVDIVGVGGAGNELGGLRGAVLSALATKLTDLCNALQLGNFKGDVEGSIKLPAYQVKKPFTYLRMQILEIIHEVVRHCAEKIVDARRKEAERLGEESAEGVLLDPFVVVPWRVLVNWFFEYSKCKLLPRIVEAFDDNEYKELRGHMILVLNEVRLGAERESRDGYLRSVLGSLQGWDKLLRQLRLVTEKQVAPLYPFKIPQIPRPAPWVGPLTPSADDLAVQAPEDRKEEQAKGIDLGSDYALSLGFLPTPPPTTPTTPTKKPPPASTLSPEEIARTFLPETAVLGQSKKKGKKKGGKGVRESDNSASDSEILTESDTITDSESERPASPTPLASLPRPREIVKGGKGGKEKKNGELNGKEGPAKVNAEKISKNSKGKS